METPDSWSVVAWLKGNAVFPNDNCPESSLIADLAIRRPQTFTPASGQMIYWQVEDVSSNAVLQSGQTMVESDDLIVIPQVEIYPETNRMVRITVSTLLLDTPKLTAGEANYLLFPNPAPVSAPLQLEVQNPVADARLTVIIYNETGQALQHFELYPGSASATITVPPSAALPAG